MAKVIHLLRPKKRNTEALSPRRAKRERQVAHRFETPYGEPKERISGGR